MKPKQLANVLIKILGLSICVHGLPAFVAAAIGAIESLIHALQDGHRTGAQFPYWTYSLTYLIQSAVEFAAGIYLVVRSRWLVEKLFKDEAE
jgi:hydrogenase/urease accessory protein HupE